LGQLAGAGLIKSLIRKTLQRTEPEVVSLQ